MSCLQLLTSSSETSSILEHPNMDGERLHRPLESPGIYSGVSLFLIDVTLAEAVGFVPRTNSQFTDATPHTQSRNAHDTESVQSESADYTLRQTARLTS